MCITATQKFYGCKCTIIRHLICSDHVAHTHRQIDNIPCYKAQSRFVETLKGGCSAACRERREEKWAFDHWVAGQGDFTFLGTGVDLRIKHPDCLDKSEFTKHHDCGIGKSFKGAWRHLNEKGEPMKEVEKEVEEGGKGKGEELEVADTEMEVEVEMEIIEERKGEDVEMR